MSSNKPAIPEISESALAKLTTAERCCVFAAMHLKHLSQADAITYCKNGASKGGPGNPVPKELQWCTMG